MSDIVEIGQLKDLGTSYQITGRDKVIRWLDDRGLLHRVGGPAVVHTRCDTSCWYHFGKRHRLDGPAVETGDGHDEWHVNGREFTEDEFYRYVDQLTGEVFVPPGKILVHDTKDPYYMEDEGLDFYDDEDYECCTEDEDEDNDPAFDLYVN
jgi:hypothetical protein